jgi:hypothetical protein
MTNVFVYVVAFSGILTHSLYYLVTQYLSSVSCFSYRVGTGCAMDYAGKYTVDVFSI